MKHSLGAALLAVVVASFSWAPAATAAAPRSASAVLAATPTPDLAWSTLNPATSPPARSGASMAYDAASGYLLLFGGTGVDGQVLGDTWAFNGTTWGEVATNPDMALTGASMAYDAALGQLLLFGGVNSAGVPQNQTFLWNGAQWTQASPTKSPPARYDATLGNVEGGGGSFVLFGGVETSTTTPNTAANPDTTAAPNTTAGSETTGGVASSSAQTSATSTANDTWIWSGTDWTEQPASGPSARAGASATWDPDLDEILLFGGSSDGTDSASSLLNDLWAWNGTTWAPLQQAAPLPPARQGATLTDDPAAGGAVLIGGQTPGGPVKDTWLYTGTTWNALNPTTPPAAATAASAAWDSAMSRLVLFGGAGTTDDTSDVTSTLAVTTGGTTTNTTATPTTHPSPSITTTGHRTLPTTSSTTGTRPTTTRPSSPSTTSALPAIVSIGGSGIAPTTVVGIVASRSSSYPGQQVAVSGNGYRPGARIAIWFHSNPVLLGHVTADSTGGFSFKVTIPTNAALGTHHFEAKGVYQTGKMESFTTPVQITPPPLPGHSHTETLVLILIALLVPATTWISMALVGRRRARVSAPT